MKDLYVSQEEVEQFKLFLSELSNGMLVTNIGSDEISNKTGLRFVPLEQDKSVSFNKLFFYIMSDVQHGG